LAAKAQRRKEALMKVGAFFIGEIGVVLKTPTVSVGAVGNSACGSYYPAFRYKSSLRFASLWAFHFNPVENPVRCGAASYLLFLYSAVSFVHSRLGNGACII
jgi:hypothetical protein